MHPIQDSRDDVAKQLFTFLTNMHKSGQAPVSQLLSKLDLTLSQLRILFILDSVDRPLALHELSDQLGLSLPATGRAVDFLWNEKFVTRTEDECDRRVKRIALAPAGVRATAGIAEARLGLLRELVDGLTDQERKALARSLAPILDRLVDPHENLKIPEARKVSDEATQASPQLEVSR